MDPIRIVRCRLFEVALPLREPFALSGGMMDVRRSLMVELQDEAGVRGLGEAAPFDAPFYSAETVSSARACISESLLPRVMAQPVDHPAALDDVLTAGLVGNEMARAGVETAWWDLAAQRAGLSLVDAVSRRLAELGVAGSWLERRGFVECGIAIGIPAGRDLRVLARDVAEAVQRGYRRVKLKIAPAWDIKPITEARDVLDRMGVSLPLTVDANGAYDLQAHRGALARLDDTGLLYVEQPLAGDALWEICELARSFRTPLCLDESLTSERVARQVVAMGGPGVWNLKVQRVGGLEQACRIYAVAARAGVRIWGGTMPESGWGAQTMLALACHRGFVYPSDLEPSDRWYEEGTDLVELTMAENGSMRVPDGRPSIDVENRGQLVHAVP